MTGSNNAEHDFVLELLPWYANGTLSPDEKAQVDQHLPSCPDCRQQLTQYRQLNSTRPVDSGAQTWKPSPVQFAGILNRIDALENTADSTASPVKIPSLFAKLPAFLKAIPSPVYWFMTMETVALAALVLLVVARAPQQQTQEQLFQTLSNERPAVTANLPRLSIVFAEDITEREIRTLLQAQQGQLVQGPSMLGVYTVQLATGGAHELQQALTNLRASPKVKLAEAVAGADRQ
ncbi:MAG: zf-HC2 domain-containing protein [Methylococcaceae bacterium]